MNYYAVSSGAILAFLVGGLWYSPLLFGNAYLSLLGRDLAAAPATTSAGEIAGELAHCLVFAAMVAQLLSWTNTTGIPAALGAGVWLWFTIYGTLSGSVLHDGTPWRLYAIHAGDGLVKALAVAALLGWWRAR